MLIDNKFFNNQFDNPCGIFSLEHILALVICITLVFLALIFTKNISRKKLNTLIKIIAITITILEILKIYINWQVGRRSMGNIVPLYFCSLFIYASLMAGFGKGVIKDTGYTFLYVAGILAGPAFLIYPATSLAFAPLFHFLSLHSLIYHSLMFYLSLILLVNKNYSLNKRGFIGYFIFTFVFCLFAFIVNYYKQSNLMFINEPVSDIKIIYDVYSFSPKLFPIIFVVIQNGGIYLVSFLIYSLYRKRIAKASN